ncbi:MAG: PadR family transcriptional regulator [Actinomycetota bacterium]|nr:PadR family transcriptional regulator [Actinomycetota bacterium]
MASAVTSAELMLLGLLAEQPRHGYDLEKVIKERGIREWTDLAFSSIYYLTAKLERTGLIEVVAHQAGPGGPPRKTYAPTAHGLAVAEEATRAALTDISPVHPPVLVGMANLPLLAHDEAIDALRTRAEGLARQLVRLQTHPRAQAPVPPFVAAIFAHAVSALDAELRWTHRTIDTLEGNHGQD